MNEHIADVIPIAKRDRQLEQKPTGLLLEDLRRTEAEILSCHWFEKVLGARAALITVELQHRGIDPDGGGDGAA